MNSHALRVLEFEQVLELIAGRAVSEPGAALVRSLRPGSDITGIRLEQSRVFAVRSLLEAENPWHPQNVPDVTASLARLAAAGAVLDGVALSALAQVLRASRLTRERLAHDRVPAVTRALLSGLVDVLPVRTEVEKMLSRAVDADGSVRDAASPALSRLRRDLRGAEGELIRLLERIAAGLDAHLQVPDMSVTVRNGRYVIPVRREGRGTIGGIVHATSATGGTLFVEPPAAVEAGNRIREMENDEALEVERILRELSESLRPHVDELGSAAESLSRLDSLYARARFAREFDCAPVEVSESGNGFVISYGRHPLLLSQRVDVVPFDLVLEPSERTMLVSGPNTGGKTVLLKCIGLFHALVQAGIPIPAGAGSRLSVIDDVFADIGDEQSIESSLSTFSAHVRNLREVLACATPMSLVLIDELGSGTDPTEGAALGGAILEALTRRGSLTIATTHLGALKELALEVQGVVNASLQFDAVLLAPTYRLLKGLPGRSYGLSIARRLELPEEVLARAEARMPAAERDVAALLADLERREAKLRDAEAEAAEIAEDVRSRARRVAERERAVRDRERYAEREARREARRLLLDARQEVERTIREFKQSAAEAAEEAAKAARRHIEEAAAAQSRALENIETRDRAGAASPATHAAPITAGSIVRVESLGGRPARVIELRDGEAVVALGSLKLTVPRESLIPAPDQQPEEQVRVVIRGAEPSFEARTEIDLRGLRAAEIDDVLMQAVDSAVRADLKSLRVIHGKGTGALRERVAEMLQKESRVKSFRLGLWNEGGAGVTVVELE